MTNHSIALTRRITMMALDCAVLTTAFWIAIRLVPILVAAAAPGGTLHVDWLANLLTFGTEAGDSHLRVRDFVGVFAVMCPSIMVCFELLGGHRPTREHTGRSIAMASILAPMAGIGVLTLVLFTLKMPGYSRLVVFSFSLISAALLAAGRYPALMVYRERLNKGYLAKEVALIGTSEVLQQVIAMFQNKAEREYSIVGYFALSPEQQAPCLSVGQELPLLGTVDQVGDVLIHTPIHDVVIGLPTDGAPWLTNVLKACDYFRVTTYVIPEGLIKTTFKDIKPIGVDSVLTCPLVKLDPVYIDSQWFFMKRMLDIFGSTVLLILLSPLMLLIAIAIKLTTPRVPILYPWRVVGYKGRRFTGYKFTTMIADIDAKKAEEALMSHNEMNGPVFKIAKDPRVTPLGRFLRKYSFNELPQLWSVLKGDMSLVGPRPVWPHELLRYDLWHKRKLSVIPGLTCFWQVRGRNRISNFDDWVRMDLEYIENWSLWLDCKLIARTAWAVLAGTGS